MITGTSIWKDKDYQSAVEDLFQDYISEMTCPGKKVVEERLGTSDILKDIPYRVIVYKINNMIQTRRRRNGIKNLK